MLPPDLIYAISVLLSPKDLIRLSLCSKYLRKVIFGNQSIWRIQYYTKWPAFFTPRDSIEDTFFPAPTWLQTFLMRKLSVLNMEKQKMRERPCEIGYQFIQDLYVHYDKGLRRLTAYKNMRQKVAEYELMPMCSNFGHTLLNRSCCGDNFFAYYNGSISEIYYFSLDGKYTRDNTGLLLDMTSIDRNRFVGTSDGGVVHSYKISPNMDVRWQILYHLPKHSFAPIHQKPGFFILAQIGWNTSGHISWCMYDFRQTQPKLIMERAIPTQYEVNRICKFVSADPDFVFIPFISDRCLFIYIYSFKEDRYRIIEIADALGYYYIAIFYDTAWNSAVSSSLKRITTLFWIYFSGTSLDSFTVAISSRSHRAARFIRISRKAFLVIAQHKLGLVDIQSGSEIWAKECYYEDVSYNERYLICSKVLYDFSPETPPKIQEWLYRLFK